MGEAVEIVVYSPHKSGGGCGVTTTNINISGSTMTTEQTRTLPRLLPSIGAFTLLGGFLMLFMGRKKLKRGNTAYYSLLEKEKKMKKIDHIFIFIVVLFKIFFWKIGGKI